MSGPYKVAVLGASPKAERYSNKAIKMLREHGHTVFPVNPYFDKIEGLPCVKELTDLKDIHTLTVYMNPKRLAEQTEQIIKLAPERVIFNPGTESAEIATDLEAHKIDTIEACTLVMLKTGQF